MDEQPNPSPAQLARWRLRTKRARAEVEQRFRSAGADLEVDWCDYAASSDAESRARALGPSPDRVIQRWPGARDFLDALPPLGEGLLASGELLVVFLDVPDAEWGRTDATVARTVILPALADWMTDGVILMSPRSEALVSLDVDESGFESTIIGEELRPLAEHLERVGPGRLPISPS